MIPKISVIMPVYNAEEFLKESIDSILNQTFKDFEFLIINDGSTDNSLKIINSYDDGRIKVINNKKNNGVAFCMNFGIKTALGEYIARMDADDISLHKRLEIQIKFLEKNKNIDICGSWAELIDKNKIIWRYPVTDKHIRSNFFFNSSIINSSFIIRKSKLMHYCLLYDNNFIHAEDFELWTRAVEFLQFYNIPKVLLKYRISNNSLRRKNNDIYVKYLEKIYENNYKKIGIKLTEREKIIIGFFINKDLIIKNDDITIIKNLFLKMIEKNNKLKIYPERQFKDTTGYYWYLLIKSNFNYKKMKYFFSKLLFYSLRTIIKRIIIRIFYMNF
ncbi:MAG: glycosyltransferase [Spirochaetes bacterium]|nr:glycosyltransferase [Spirochaetota bacterium]